MNTLALEHNGTPIEDLTEETIASMNPQDRVSLVTTAQRFCASGGEITVPQSANLTRLLIHIRRRAVADNPRASRAAKEAATAKPASADDI